MRRFLTSPGWLIGHVFVVAAALTCLWLGWWQWEAAFEHGGSMQNLGYALQWPLFAAFGVYAWVKTIRMELHAKPDRPAAAAPPAPPEPVVVDDSDDPELAAYNRRLAELHARHHSG